MLIVAFSGEFRGREGKGWDGMGYVKVVLWDRIWDHRSDHNPRAHSVDAQFSSTPSTVLNVHRAHICINQTFCRYSSSLDNSPDHLTNTIQHLVRIGGFDAYHGVRRRASS